MMQREGRTAGAADLNPSISPRKRSNITATEYNARGAGTWMLRCLKTFIRSLWRRFDPSRAEIAAQDEDHPLGSKANLLLAIEIPGSRGHPSNGPSNRLPSLKLVTYPAFCLQGTVYSASARRIQTDVLPKTTCRCQRRSL